MIKINLLPHSVSAKTANIEKQILVFILFLLIITAKIIVLGFWSQARLDELERIAHDKLGQRQTMLSTAAIINKKRKDIDQIQSNIDVIRDIRLTQQLPVIYIDETVRCLPEDKIWFEALELNEHGVLDIRGIAIDNQAFAGYIDEIRNSAYVSSVNTLRTSSRQVMNLDLVEFQFQVRTGPKNSRQDLEAHEN